MRPVTKKPRIYRIRNGWRCQTIHGWEDGPTPERAALNYLNWLIFGDPRGY